MTLTSTQHPALRLQRTLVPSGSTYEIDDWTLVQVSDTQWDLRGPEWPEDRPCSFLAEFGINPDWTCEAWVDDDGDGTSFYAPGFHPRV